MQVCNDNKPGGLAIIVGSLLAHPAMREWYEAALQETEADAHYDDLAMEYGGAR